MEKAMTLPNASHYKLEPIASGLVNPADLVVTAEKSVYVLETGHGGDGAKIPGPELNVSLELSAEGAITRSQDGKQERISEGFPSLTFLDEQTGEFRPQSLGLHGIALDPSNENVAYLTVGLGSNPENRDALGAQGANLGHLLKVNLDTDSCNPIKPLADLAEYERTFNPDGGTLVSNPWSVVSEGNEFVAVDSGANTLNRIAEDGTIVARTVFASRMIGDAQVESVPTGVAIGPDSAYYVAELTGKPYLEDEARIYRVEDVGEEPTVFAEGFTQLIDLDFDPMGNLYVLEYASDSLLKGGTHGSLIQVTPEGTRTTISGDELIFPTGLDVTDDGSVYVSSRGLEPGDGQVFRYTPCKEIPEVSQPLGSLTPVGTELPNPLVPSIAIGGVPEISLSGL
jgi:hypothetical protein